MSTTRAMLMRSAAGAAGSILIGIAFHRMRVFDIRMAAFQFITLGITVSMLLGLARAVSWRVFVLSAVALFALNAAVARSTTPGLLLRDAVFVGGLAAAAYLAERLAARAAVAASVLRRSAVRVAVLVGGYFAAGMALCLAMDISQAGRLACVYAHMGLLIAVGVVAGVEVAAATAPRS